MTVTVPYPYPAVSESREQSRGAPLKTYACCLIDGFSLTVARVTFSSRTVADACDHAVDLVKSSQEARGFDLWFNGRRIVCLRPGGPAACVIKITEDIETAMF